MELLCHSQTALAWGWGGKRTTQEQRASQGDRAGPNPTALVPPSPRPHSATARGPTWPWCLPGAAPPGRGPSARAPECSSCLRPCGALPEGAEARSAPATGTRGDPTIIRGRGVPTITRGHGEPVGALGLGDATTTAGQGDETITPGLGEPTITRARGVPKTTRGRGDPPAASCGRGVASGGTRARADPTMTRGRIAPTITRGRGDPTTTRGSDGPTITERPWGRGAAPPHGVTACRGGTADDRDR